MSMPVNNNQPMGVLNQVGKILGKKKPGGIGAGVSKAWGDYKKLPARERLRIQAEQIMNRPGSAGRSFVAHPARSLADGANLLWQAVTGK